MIIANRTASLADKLLQMALHDELVNGEYNGDLLALANELAEEVVLPIDDSGEFIALHAPRMQKRHLVEILAGETTRGIIAPVQMEIQDGDEVLEIHYEPLASRINNQIFTACRRMTGNGLVRSSTDPEKFLERAIESFTRTKPGTN